MKRSVVLSLPSSIKNNRNELSRLTNHNIQSYRNTVYSPPSLSSWSAFLMYYYSTQSQGPEVVFPIGEVPYLSNITYVEEKLPVSIDVLAHRGCDLMLLDLAKDLADAGLLREVKTGSTLW